MYSMSGQIERDRQTLSQDNAWTGLSTNLQGLKIHTSQSTKNCTSISGHTRQTPNVTLSLQTPNKNVKFHNLTDIKKTITLVYSYPSITALCGSFLFQVRFTLKLKAKCLTDKIDRWTPIQLTAWQESRHSRVFVAWVTSFNAV